MGKHPTFWRAFYEFLNAHLDCIQVGVFLSYKGELRRKTKTEVGKMKNTTVHGDAVCIFAGTFRYIQTILKKQNLTLNEYYNKI